jgi:hypothetical protein
MNPNRDFKNLNTMKPYTEGVSKEISHGQDTARTA